VVVEETAGSIGTPGKSSPTRSSAIRTGDRLFLSGMLGSTEANKGDAAGQTRGTPARPGRTLKAAGFDWIDVVDAVVYLPSLKDFAAMNTACREVFPKAFPVAPDGLVEIMMLAGEKR
jgi:enamine deaminase RidA (YjgF/YER057c/UK114 family)